MSNALASLILAWMVVAVGGLQKGPSAGAHAPSQAAADVLREKADADGAFIAAGDINPTYDPKNLASLIELPTEKIVVINLKGSGIRAAFERSVALYPQPSTSFLQISGFTVEFKGSGPAHERIISIKAGGDALDMAKTYKIAMSSGLADGAMGYFKIWDKSKTYKTLDTTLEQALAGKPFVESAPRWVLR